MPKKATVFLEDVADRFDMAMDNIEQYLNTATGKFVELLDDPDIDFDLDLEEQPEWAADYLRLADAVAESDDYVALPGQQKLREYDIMADFAETVPDVRPRDKLFYALNGKKPFRHFKDTLNATGLAQAYYAFRLAAFVEIAADWCEAHDIPYARRQEPKPAPNDAPPPADKNNVEPFETYLKRELTGDEPQSFIYKLHEDGFFDEAALRQILENCRVMGALYQSRGATPAYVETARLILDRLAYIATLIFCHYAPNDNFRITNWRDEFADSAIPEFFAAMREISADLIL